MAISKEAMAYCKRGIIRFINGDTEEFKKLVNLGMKINDEIENKNNLVSCRYKIDGKFIPAKIDLKLGIIYGIKGEVLRKCIVQEVKNNDDRRIS